MIANMVSIREGATKCDCRRNHSAKYYCSDPWGVCGAACNHSSYPWNICMQKCTCHATCECDEGQSGEYCKSVCS